jgi:hypothetical protein
MRISLLLAGPVINAAESGERRGILVASLREEMVRGKPGGKAQPIERIEE